MQISYWVNIVHGIGPSKVTYCLLTSAETTIGNLLHELGPLTNRPISELRLLNGSRILSPSCLLSDEVTTNGAELQLSFYTPGVGTLSGVWEEPALQRATASIASTLELLNAAMAGMK